MARARVLVPRGAKRKTFWLSGPDETGATQVAAGASDLQGSLNAAALDLRPFTVIRTIGQILVGSDQIASDEFPFGAFGITVVTVQASIAGIASIPTPVTEESADWFCFQFALARWQFNTSGAAPPQVYSFDQRGMRKVSENADIVSVFENGNSTHGVSYLARWKMLIKLH